MAVSSVVKNFRDGTILIEDGTGTPLAVTVQYEAGDFSISGLNQSNTEATTYLDRGELGSVRKTNRTFPTFSFSAHMTDLSDGTDSIPLSRIAVASAGTLAHPAFGAAATAVTPTAGRIINRSSNWTFSYNHQGATAPVGAGTYETQVTYTAVAP